MKNECLIGVGFASCAVALRGPYLNDGSLYLLTVTIGPFGTCPGPQDVDLAGEIGPLPAGSYPVYLTDDDGPASFTLAVTDPGPELQLWGGRFRLSVEWDPPGGAEPRLAGSLRASDQAGSFYFFDEGNLELSLKLLDGSAVNGRFWLFVASLTNLGFRLRVTDTGDGSCLAEPASCPTYVFSNPAGVNSNLLDFTTLGGHEASWGPS